MSTQVLKTGSEAETASAVRQAARALRAGRLVAFPTETVYGVGVVATDVVALERLRDLKNRPSKPFSVHMGRRDDLERYVSDVPPLARRLIARAWPGPVTLLLPTGDFLADDELQKAGLYRRLVSDGVIGLRCPSDPVAGRLLSAVGDPVVASSANLAGQPSPRSGDDVLASLDGRIDLLVDAGPTSYGKDSTIVRFGRGQMEVVREGVYDARSLRKLLRLRLLFLCTGNTCRSPLAGGIAKRMLADRLGCQVSELRREGVEVHTAGLLAAEGVRAPAEAIEAARGLGADISHHHSRKVTPQLIHDADVVFCMTDAHVGQARREAPAAADRIHRLDGKRDIPDPIGEEAAGYRRTAEQIGRALEARLKELGF